MTSAKKFYLYIIIFSIIFTSLPIFPSDYRPITPILLAPLAISYLRNIKGKIRQLDLLVVALLIWLLVHGFIFSENLSVYARSAAPVIFGLVSYLGLTQALKRESLESLRKPILFTFYFLAAFCSAEFVFSNILGLDFFKNHLISPITGGQLVGRLQGTTSEASWLARIALVGICLVNLCRYKSRDKLLIYYLLGIFTLTISLEGIVTIITSYILSNLIHRRFKPFIIAICISIALIPATILGIGAISKFNSDAYYMTRFAKILDGNLSTIRDIALLDGSTFIRLYYPAIGIDIFKDNIFGVGLGNYPKYFNKYISHYYDLAPYRYPEVDQDIATATGDPRSLYSKIAAESGIVGLTITFFLSLNIYRRILKIQNIRLTFFIISIGVSLIQFGTLAYIPLWLSIAIISKFKAAPSINNRQTELQIIR